MSNAGWLWSQYRGSGLHLQLIWGTSSYFRLLWLHQSASRLVTVFLGTLWCSIKQIKATYLFDWEQEISLQAMQGNPDSSHGKGEVSWFFLSCSRNLGYILELRHG